MNTRILLALFALFFALIPNFLFAKEYSRSSEGLTVHFNLPDEWVEDKTSDAPPFFYARASDDKGNSFAIHLMAVSEQGAKNMPQQILYSREYVNQFKKEFDLHKSEITKIGNYAALEMTLAMKSTEGKNIAILHKNIPFRETVLIFALYANSSKSMEHAFSLLDTKKDFFNEFCETAAIKNSFGYKAIQPIVSHPELTEKQKEDFQITAIFTCVLFLLFCFFIYKSKKYKPNIEDDNIFAKKLRFLKRLSAVLLFMYIVILPCYFVLKIDNMTSLVFLSSTQLNIISFTTLTISALIFIFTLIFTYKAWAALPEDFRLFPPWVSLVIFIIPIVGFAAPIINTAVLAAKANNARAFCKLRPNYFTIPLGLTAVTTAVLLIFSLIKFKDYQILAYGFNLAANSLFIISLTCSLLGLLKVIAENPPKRKFGINRILQLNKIGEKAQSGVPPIQS